MEKIYVKEILEAVGGQLLGDVDPERVFVVNVQTDSRRVEAGDLFVAIIGERMDGHRFAAGAMEAGAEGCLVSKAPEAVPAGKFCVLVPDTARAMGDLAAYYRRKMGIPVVAVTGSVGKTTTKEMIAAVLSTRYRTLKTAGNLNNHLGLPMTVLRTKCEIFRGLKKGGTAVLNGDDELLATLRPGAERVRDSESAEPAESGEFAKMYAGIDAGGFTFHWAGESEACDYRALNIQDSLTDRVCCDAQTPSGTFALEIPNPGRHMIYPAMTAAAVGQYFGLSDEEIASGIRNFKVTGMRMAVEKLEGGFLLFNDAYNANPQSMKAALGILANAKAAHKVAVVGDMLELEPFAEKLHRQVGEYAAELPIDTLVTVGTRAGWIAEAALEIGMEDVRPCVDKEEAKKVLAELLEPDTVFLFKASRGMALEELFGFVKEAVESR